MPFAPPGAARAAPCAPSGERHRGDERQLPVGHPEPERSLEVRGIDALEARVGRAYEMFVAAGEYHFETDGEPVLLTPRVVGLRWAMVANAGGEAVGGGLDVLALDDDGRIRTDHQYVG